MMHMTFYWGKEVTLLFTSWKTATWLSYSLSLLACLIGPIIYQFLENQRIRLKLISSAAKPSSPPDTVESPLLQLKAGSGKLSGAKIAGAILFGINSAIGYLLMLAVMSFNGGVFIAVVLGLSIGYFLFRNEDENLKVVDNPCACA